MGGTYEKVEQERTYAMRRQRAKLLLQLGVQLKVIASVFCHCQCDPDGGSVYRGADEREGASGRNEFSEVDLLVPPQGA